MRINQKDGEIRQLFKFSQLLLCANDESIKYATAGTIKKFYSIWHNKEDDGKIDGGVYHYAYYYRRGKYRYIHFETLY